MAREWPDSRRTLKRVGMAGWRLQLGDVRESARVRLNGRDAGTVWAAPFELEVGESFRPGSNTIEIEVTNLSANRVRDLDRRGVDWKRFYDINFVSVRYGPFDASEWPVVESGLLGPVRLIPIEWMHPVLHKPNREGTKKRAGWGVGRFVTTPCCL